MNWMAEQIKSIVKVGDFVLASGRRSRYYIDLRELTLSAHFLNAVASEAVARMRACDVTVLGGPATAAIPIVAAALAIDVPVLPHPQRGFYVRKEDKDHGAGGRISGPLQKGDRFLLVDDVATTGWSMVRAARAAIEAGGICAGAYAVLDREEGADALLQAELGVRLYSSVRLHELGLQEITACVEAPRDSGTARAYFENGDLIVLIEEPDCATKVRVKGVRP